MSSSVVVTHELSDHYPTHNSPIHSNQIQIDDANDENSDIIKLKFSMEMEKEIVKQEPPDMWSWGYIGLYAQYAAVGLLYGTGGALLPLCVYVYDGESNLCANGFSIVTFAWSFKIFFAILTDIYRPFGMRRKPWMIFGWLGVLLCLLVLAFDAGKMTVSSWLSCLLMMQALMMFSDVPADGYSVEVGSMDSDIRINYFSPPSSSHFFFFFFFITKILQTNSWGS